MRRYATIGIIIVLISPILVGYYYTTSTPKPFLRAHGVRALSLFPDGRVVIVAEVPLTNIGYLSIYSPNGTQLWNLTFGREGTYWDDVLYAKVSPDGRYLGVLTVTRAMLYGENITLLWERKIGSWWGGVWWADIEFSKDSEYVGFGISGSKSAFYVFSINGTPLINGTDEGIVGMRVSAEGIYLMKDYLFSVGAVNSRIFHLGFDGTNWSLEFPHGSPRGLDIFETPNGTYVAYADCGFGLTLIWDGKVLWNRDNGTCYWDVVFWNGKVYGDARKEVDKLAVYSLDGTLIDEINLQPASPWTILPGKGELILLGLYRGVEEEKTYVGRVRDDTLELLRDFQGYYVGDHASHAFGEYRNGRLLFGIYGNEEKPDEVSLISVEE